MSSADTMWLKATAAGMRYQIEEGERQCRVRLTCEAMQAVCIPETNSPDIHVVQATLRHAAVLRTLEQGRRYRIELVEEDERAHLRDQERARSMHVRRRPRDVSPWVRDMYQRLQDQQRR